MLKHHFKLNFQENKRIKISSRQNKSTNARVHLIGDGSRHAVVMWLERNPHALWFFSVDAASEETHRDILRKFD